MRKRLLSELREHLDLKVGVWNSFDLIGDLVLLKAPVYGEETTGEGELEEFRRLAQELMRRLPYVKGVFLALTPVGGEYRIRRVLHLAGKDDPVTLYREHGCVFKVDLTGAYISPRLSFEHARVARMVGEGEFVVNMFAGVGGFSVMIARFSKAHRVVSIDKNPRALQLMVENIGLNRVEETVVPVGGDAVNVIRAHLTGVADRVLMPLPSFEPHFYEAAVTALRDIGFVHAYEFVRVDSGISRKHMVEKAFRMIEDTILSKTVFHNVELELVGGRVVRSVGPRFVQVAVDFRVLKHSKA